MYMNKTFGTFKDRIVNLVHIFAPGLYRASQRYARQVDVPKFDIVDEGGKVLAKGQFKYG